MKKKIILSLLTLLSCNTFASDLDMKINDFTYMMGAEHFMKNNIFNKHKKIPSEVYHTATLLIKDKEYKVSFVRFCLGKECKITKLSEFKGTEYSLKTSLIKNGINYDDFLNELNKKVEYQISIDFQEELKKAEPYIK